MKYTHRFRVRAPLETVADFHRQAGSMSAITPPPVIVQMHETPEVLDDGDEMEFTLWLLAIPIRWRARVESVSSAGFVDRQLQGPFRLWRHHHAFIAVTETETDVVDEIEAMPGHSPWSWLVSMGVWWNLPLLFSFRAWKTRRILERGDEKRAAGVVNSRKQE